MFKNLLAMPDDVVKPLISVRQSRHRWSWPQRALKKSHVSLVRDVQLLTTLSSRTELLLEKMGQCCTALETSPRRTISKQLEQLCVGSCAHCRFASVHAGKAAHTDSRSSVRSPLASEARHGALLKTSVLLVSNMYRLLRHWRQSSLSAQLNSSFKQSASNGVLCRPGHTRVSSSNTAAWRRGTMVPVALSKHVDPATLKKNDC